MMIGGGGKLPVCRAGSYATILYVNIRGDKQVGGGEATRHRWIEAASSGGRCFWN
jgi:hypothetical protein